MRGDDHEGAADSLEEEKDGRHLRQIRSRGGSLDRDDRDLGCNTSVDTSDDLIPDPLPLLSADIQCIKQPRTDGPCGSNNDDDRRRDAVGGDVSAASEHGDGNGQNQWQVSHATHLRADVIDALQAKEHVSDILSHDYLEKTKESRAPGVVHAQSLQETKTMVSLVPKAKLLLLANSIHGYQSGP